MLDKIQRQSVNNDRNQSNVLLLPNLSYTSILKKFIQNYFTDSRQGNQVAIPATFIHVSYPSLIHWILHKNNILITKTMTYFEYYFRIAKESAFILRFSYCGQA